MSGKQRQETTIWKRRKRETEKWGKNLSDSPILRFPVSNSFTISLLSIVCLFLFPSISISNSEDNPAESFGKPLEFKEMAEAIKRIQDVQKNIDIISASVHQKKRNPILKNEIETKGAITMKRPNLLYWDITEPERHVTIVDGKNMWVYQPDLKEARKYTLSEQFMARQAMNFFSSAMNMSTKEMEKNFDIAVYNPDGNLILEMKPKSSMVAKYLVAIHIWYKEGEAVPYKFEVIGKKGDTTITEFIDVVLNPSIKENLFHFDAPAGVNVTIIGNEGPSY
ncbi:MAG: outer membrane lipoprotein carrier protein LolA [Deltaproteobacteria bacterium]|nr:outer membrane lipoprotein carrier protein LolA [Deltaproteobacteria bacterium]